MKNPNERQQKETVKESDLLWEDAVTGSVFKIDASVYEDLLQRLQIELAKQKYADACYALWEQEYMPFGKYKDMEIAIHLPFPTPLSLSKWQTSNEKVRTRLVDHVLLRTGLYYALHPQLDPHRWEEVRRELLQVDCSIASAIDDYLINGKWSENGKVDIVKAGAVKIKQYMVETSNIQEIRGASILLDEIEQYRIKNLNLLVGGNRLGSESNFFVKLFNF